MLHTCYIMKYMMINVDDNNDFNQIKGRNSEQNLPCIYKVFLPKCYLMHALFSNLQTGKQL